MMSYRHSRVTPRVRGVLHKLSSKDEVKDTMPCVLQARGTLSLACAHCGNMTSRYIDSIYGLSNMILNGNGA